MRQLTDLDINCAVRRVLVRHWIDLGKLILRTTGGIVNLSGALEKICKSNEDLNPGLLIEITSELRRIPCVRRVNMGFTNWVEHDGVWKMVLTSATKKKTPEEKQHEHHHVVVEVTE